jgi:restriction endonuclease S subunit
MTELERTRRLDSEFFRREFAEISRTVRSIAHEDVATLCNVSDGNHFSISEDFVDEGVPYYRGQDVVGRFFIEQSSPNYITPEAYARPHMVRSHLRRGDVLLSIVGTIGELSLVTSDQPATCSCKLAILRPSSIAPEYLAILLQSRFGRLQIERLKRGAVQMGLILEDMDQLVVPRFKLLETRIADTVKLAKLSDDAAQDGMASSDAKLASALGLAAWSPPEPLTYSASCKAAFGAGRLDAQFFSPRYDELFAHIKATGQAVRFKDILSTNARGNQPVYADAGLAVINSKHVRANRIESADQRLADPSEANVLIEEGDLLLNGTGVGTIGRAAPWLSKSKAIPDNHVTVLRAKGLDPIYLSVFLNSRIGQMQVERHTRGSSGQVELYPSDIAEFMIWHAPDETQKAIRQCILGAFAAEAKAKTLLDVAKRAVEIAIEDSETAALAFLKAAGA